MVPAWVSIGVAIAIDRRHEERYPIARDGLPMIEITREIIAYTIIAIIVAIAVPVVVRMRIKRHRDRLRRRGIKRHGH
jgi:hypothetical protein